MIHVFDIDNTLFDSGLRIQSYFSDYQPENQVGYKLDARYLDLFSRPEFYLGEAKEVQFEVEDFVNQAVYHHVLRLVDAGEVVQFISASPNEEVQEAKEQLLEYLFYPLLGQVTLWHTQHTDEESLILQAFPKRAKVLFYDDAPHRFDLFSRLGYLSIRIPQPYNGGYDRQFGTLPVR